MSKGHHIKIAEALATRIRHIYAILGYQSVADFVQVACGRWLEASARLSAQAIVTISTTIKATMDKLPREESRYDEIQEAIKSGEYQKWEKE